MSQGVGAVALRVRCRVDVRADVMAGAVAGVSQNCTMDVDQAVALLGGLSAAGFMRRHWQKKPLLVRQAWPGVCPPLPRAALFELAGSDSVESRLVQRVGFGQALDGTAAAWRVRCGPLPRRAFPALSKPGWTLLVQGLDLHVPAAHELLQRFRFVPDARLDDLMVSWASPGGGVGAHIDRYDVFLLQVQGRRRWRVAKIARRPRPLFVEGAPLKLLQHFEATDEWLLEAGDMLYLPPGWAHEGTADGGDCMTCSIGFRAPAADELARELLLRLADEADDNAAYGPRIYRDPKQPATATPAALPADLLAFAREALERQLADPRALPRLLGEVMTEPKAHVFFKGRNKRVGGLQLDAGTRMLYDASHVFVNGEAFAAGGRDATLMRKLADCRQLSAADRARLSAPAAELLAAWIDTGWLHGGRR